jgi:hypothetical protein
MRVVRAQRGAQAGGVEDAALAVERQDLHARVGGQPSTFTVDDVGRAVADDFVPGRAVQRDGDLVGHGG